MIETAENLRKAYGISREEQDQLAVRSHQRAVAAHEAGKFADELSRSRFPASAASPTRSSTATRILEPTPVSRPSARSARSGPSWIPNPPSPQATPPARTTARRWSPPAPKRRAAA
jgi:acetyl-CoA acetyltransferase